LDYTKCPFCNNDLTIHYIPSYDDSQIIETYLECNNCGKNNIDVADWQDAIELAVDQAIDREIDERNSVPNN
tara:strand:- start:427 stop:642 length:216 start_codon:yes stop_codon:yes gene_type:complete